MRIPALSIIALLSLAASAGARDITVDNAKDIKAAMAAAQPGDTIAIKPGEYDVGDGLSCANSGTKDSPITLRAAGDKDYAKLKVTGRADVGFRVRGKFWVLRGLHIMGNPAATEDLIQVEGNLGASDLHMVDCKISGCKEFLVKASRTRESGPNNVVIEHCEWFDCGGTAIDLPTGDNWVIRGNYVHDYGKGSGTHYGMFYKGGGKNGLFEGNLVDGKNKAAIGISFGGGLTGHQWMPLVAGSADKVVPEATGGICRNNIVINTTDCAYHSNNASDCKFYNNLAYHCGAGFQMQASYPPDCTLINNVLSGAIKKPGKAENNLTKVDPAWFVAPDKQDFRLTDAGKAALAGKGSVLADNPTDFFGQPRKAGSPLDLGPVNADDNKVSTQWVDRRAAGAGSSPQPTPTPSASPAAPDKADSPSPAKPSPVPPL